MQPVEVKMPVFDVVRHMVRIGQHPTHRELRQRYEARLAALKAAGRLTEDRSKAA